MPLLEFPLPLLSLGSASCSLQLSLSSSDKFKWVRLSIKRHKIVIEVSNMGEMTTEILEQNLGKKVIVRLRGGRSLRGILKGFDQHLNLVLDDTENTTNFEDVKKMGLIIVRGDNVVIVSPPPR